ncbi:MAG: M15 family metallopeptidase [Proteobacteria bacterium]|nr:M15 family metallopeptidase [Pseudomonadota bacterium]
MIRAALAALTLVAAVAAPAAAESTLLIWTAGALPPGLGDTVRALPQVRTLTVVESGNAPLIRTVATGGVVAAAPAGTAWPLETMVLDAAYAGFVPAAHASLFAALGAGDVIVGRTASALRGVGVGATMEFDGGHVLTVRAVVDDAEIGGGEIAVAASSAVVRAVPRHILLAYDGPRAELEAAVRALLGDRPVRFRAPGEAPILRFADAVLPQARIKARFGEFALRLADFAPGATGLARDAAWVEANLVTDVLPILGEVRCHRALLDAVQGALTELRDSGLAFLVDPAAFRGCDNPRRIAGSLALSRHAWGAAIDLDAGPAPMHRDHMTDPRLLDVMARWGLTSGHDWLVPDPGHFE